MILCPRPGCGNGSALSAPLPKSKAGSLTQLGCRPKRSVHGQAWEVGSTLREGGSATILLERASARALPPKPPQQVLHRSMPAGLEFGSLCAHAIPQRPQL